MLEKKDVVLLTVPYCEPLPLVAPVLLASCLEDQGITAKAVDFNIEFYNEFKNTEFFIKFRTFLTLGHLHSSEFSRNTFKKIIKFTKSFIRKIQQDHNPDYIGISIFTAESLDFGQILSYVIRRHFPEITIIAGGKGLETKNNGKYNYDIWIENHVVDAIVVGDAEFTISKVIKEKMQGVVYADQQTKQDLDKIPLAKWSDYDLTKYTNGVTQTEPYLSITSSKGCVRKCTFCDVADFWPEYLLRDPVKVVDEMVHNYEKTGIKKFMFTDNLINGSITNFRKMNQLIIERLPNTITYSGYAIFRGKHQMPEEDFYLASLAGNSRWSVGVESGSERVRNEMKKKFTNDDLDWSIQMLAKYNILQNWLLMVGYPSETEEDFEDTKKLIMKYRDLGAEGRITVSITPTFMLLKNSPLITNIEIAKKYGLEHNVTTSNTDKFWTSTVYKDNLYPVRSRRWKEIVSLAESLKYTFNTGMPVEQWKKEIKLTDELYEKEFKPTTVFYFDRKK